jgi:hypothetical protein
MMVREIRGAKINPKSSFKFSVRKIRAGGNYASKYGTLNRHRRVLCRVKQYQAVKTGEEVQTLRELNLVLRYTYIVCLVFLLLSTAHTLFCKLHENCPELFCPLLVGLYE